MKKFNTFLSLRGAKRRSNLPPTSCWAEKHQQLRLPRSLRSLAMTVLLCGFSYSTFAASSSDVQVKAQVTNAFITIGEKVDFTVTVTHPKNVQVLQLDSSKALNDFEVKSEKNFSHKVKDQIQEGKTFTITNYQLGEYVIRPVRADYRKQTGGPVESAETNELYVTVKSVDDKKDPNSDIKGIKSVTHMKARIWPWILVFLVALTGIGIFIYIRYKNQLATLIIKSEPALSPHDEAYQALGRLENSDLLVRKEYKLYFLTLSEIIRRYLERRYQFAALESTTTEILSVLKTKVDNEQKKLLDSVLSLCDLVKFAKWEPQPIEIITVNKQAKELIDRTKEIIVEPTPNPENTTKT